MDTNEPYPWPQEGDDPLALGDDWQHNACLNFWGTEVPWAGYAEGFKLAGDALVGRIETTKADQDFLVYPIMFNYRQYIELALKGLIRDARRLVDEGRGAPHGHDLVALWNTAEPLLLRIEPKSQPRQRGRLHRTIRRG